jgi:ABC-2 type transport system ATP-binding protein
MKQRLAIGNALLGKPKVLVFDEPTNGLDPAGIAEIRELIKTLNAEGVTVIMASHLLDEVEKVCTHVAILKRGDLLLTGSVDEVMHGANEIEIAAEDMAALRTTVEGVEGLKIVANGNAITVTASKDMTPARLNELCASRGIMLSHLVQKKKSLEHTFMELTGGDTA